MATVTITLTDLGDEMVVAAEFDPAPSDEAIQTHSHELTVAQHTAVHLMEMLGAAAQRLEPGSSKGKTLLAQRDDPRYKL